MPRQRQQTGEAGEPSRANRDFGVSPHSMSPKQNGSPVSVGTLESRGTLATAAHIGGYDSESVRDHYTSERSPTTDSAMPGYSPQSDMLYFDDDDNDLGEIYVNGDVKNPTPAPDEAIEQVRESELSATQPFTVPREMGPTSKGLAVEPAGGIEHPEGLGLEDPWSISEDDRSDASNRDESYYPSETNDTPMKRQKKPKSRKTARKEPAVKSTEALTNTLHVQSLKGRPKASAHQDRGNKTSDSKNQPGSNMARRIYASRAAHLGGQGALYANMPATQTVPAALPQRKSSASRVPKKSFLSPDKMLAEYSHDAVVEPELERSGPKSRGNTSTVGSQMAERTIQATSSNGSAVSATENSLQADIHSSEFFSQPAAVLTAGSRKKALPKACSKKANSKQREDPKTTDDAARDASGHVQKLGTLSPALAADPFEIEVSPEPDTHYTRAKVRKCVDNKGKKDSNSTGAAAPTLTLGDTHALKPKSVAGSNLKKKRSSVGHVSNLGRERMARKSHPEKQQTESGMGHFDHHLKHHSLPQQQPTAETHIRNELSRQKDISRLSENINDDFPPLNGGNLAENRDHEKGNSRQAGTQDTVKTEGRKHLHPTQVAKALSPASKKQRNSDTNVTPVRPIEEIEPPTPEVARHISVNITGSPVALNLRQQRGNLQGKANDSNQCHSNGRSDVVITITDDTSSSSIVNSSPTPVSRPEEKSVQGNYNCSEEITEKDKTAPRTSKKAEKVRLEEPKNSIGTGNLSTDPAPDYSEQPLRQPLLGAKQQPAVSEVNVSRIRTASNDPQQLQVKNLRPREVQYSHPIDVGVAFNQPLRLEAVSNSKNLHSPSNVFLSAHEIHMKPGSHPLNHSRSQQVAQESGTQHYSATSGNSNQRKRTRLSVHPKTQEFARKIMQQTCSQSGTRQGSHQTDSDQAPGEGQSRDGGTQYNDQEERIDFWQKAINHAQSGLAESMHGVTSSILRRIKPRDVAIESIIHEYKHNGRSIATKLLQRQKRESESAMASYDRVFHRLEKVYDLASSDITTIKEGLALKCVRITDLGRENESQLQKDREAIRLAREQFN